MGRIEDFQTFREEMNHEILHQGNRDTKRFFGLDRAVFEDGELDRKTKEMMGLVSSLVLRCDDCITYHLITCHELGVTGKEFFELFNVAMLVGGSICIPHVRRAVKTLNELLEDKGGSPSR
ncbi:MAG: carboxymuconolactone decarboxylase family protein [Fidelibacterota bacterium]